MNSEEEKNAQPPASKGDKALLGRSLAVCALVLGLITAIAELSERFGAANPAAGVIGVALVVLLIAPVALRRILQRRAAARQPSSGAGIGRYWQLLRRPTAVASLALVAVASIGLTSWALSTVGNELDPTPPVPQPPSSAPPSPGPADNQADGFEQFDDFSSDELRPDLWDLSGDADVIYARDGQLHLEVVPERTIDNDLEATLQARLSPLVRGVRFDIGIDSIGAPSRGAAYAIVLDSAGRQQRLAAGPSGGSTAPEVGYEFCEQNSPCQRNYSYLAEENVLLGKMYQEAYSVCHERRGRLP